MERTSGATLKSSASTVEVSAKAQRNFTKLYKSARDTYWVGLMDGGKAADCVIDGLKHRVYFDDRDRWIGAMTHLTETTMPSHLHALVRNRYNNFQIYEVIKIEAASGTTYYVYMDNAKEYLTVSYAFDELKIVTNYKKGLP
jgi:hypothetical protein